MMRRMRWIPFLRRHTIASAASVVLLGGTIALLARRGLLGPLLPPADAWRGGVSGALAVTLGLFFPFAAVAEWVVARRRWPAWAGPVAFALSFTAAAVAIDAARGTFAPRYLLYWLILGSYLGMVFCGYWIPLRLVHARTSHGIRTP